METGGEEAAGPEHVRFVSGDADCAALYYPGTNGACVIMAAGGAVTKEPGTDPFAQDFHRAGFTVLAFDYRGLGESSGRPRQVLNVRRQLADWQAAIGHAQTLPGVDPNRLAAWGFSLSGGHIFRVAARNRGLRAAIAQTPLADGPAASRLAARHQTALAMTRLAATGLLDGIGGTLGRPPVLVPLAAEPGTVAMLTTPDANDGDRALNPDNTYPDWQQSVAARSALRLGLYRPGRYAAQVKCPLLVVVCNDDQSALAEPAARAASRAPHGEVLRLPGGHYEPFLGGHDEVVDAELSFLRRHLLAGKMIPT